MQSHGEVVEGKMSQNMNFRECNSVCSTWPHLVARKPGKHSMSSEPDSITNIGDLLVVIHTTQLFMRLVLLGTSFGNTALVSLLFYLQFSEPQHHSHIYIQKYIFFRDQHK